MSEQQLHNTQPSGKTTGTAQRPAHEHTGPMLAFDLYAELQRLRQEESWERGVRNARTLVKEPDLRVVLIVMKAGARMEEHFAPGRLTIQVLAGHLRLHLLERSVDLATAHLLELDRQVHHDVEALEESAFVLTIAWPVGAAEE